MRKKFRKMNHFKTYKFWMKHRSLKLQKTSSKKKSKKSLHKMIKFEITSHMIILKKELVKDYQSMKI